MWHMSSWPRRYWRWVTPIAIFALLAGSFTPGLAKPVAAASEYLISGHVIGSDGATPANIQVDAYGDTGSDYGFQTGTDGYYSLLVPPDNYIVKFFGNGTNYVDGCLAIGSIGNFTTDVYACPEVTVTNSDVPLPTVTLPLGVRIKGTVTGSDGATPENILVDADTGSPGPVTDTGGGGIFSLLVPPGSYKLYFHDDLNSTYVDGCYSSGASGNFTTDPNACSTLTLTMGSTVPWLNVTIPVGLRISGKVIDQNGQALPNMWVGLSPNNFGWLGMTTASDGTYSFAVIPGSYTVAFWGSYSDHVGGCYSSVANGNLESRQATWDSSQALCSRVTVTTSPVPLPDVTMPLGVHIRGTVTGPDGKPLNNIAVAISITGTSTATDGTYSSTPVLPGSYTVSFYDDGNGTSTHVDGCYDLGASGNFTPDFSACTPVTVGTSDVPGIDVKMPLAGGGTPVGSEIPVVPATSPGVVTQPVSLTFSNVDSPGATTLTTSSTPPAPLPAGYQVGGSPIYFDLETAATYTGPITVCSSYAGITLVPTNLLHYENGAWVDITTSVDTTSQTICGTTTSLSPFVLVTKIVASQTITFTSEAPSDAVVGGPTYTPTASGGASGNPVTFTIDSTSSSVCSISAGVVSFIGVGTCTIDANQAGNDTYNAAPQVTQGVKVNKVPTTLTYAGPTAATTGTSITLSATLKTSAGAAIGGKPISFIFNGATLTATTNNSGVASVKTTAPAKVGTYPISIAFAGDATYAAASISATLTVTIATTLTYLGSTKVAPGASITLVAWLHAGPLTPVAGKTVTFTLNGATKTATTNSLGIALVNITAPATTGTYPLTFGFAGDSRYAAAPTSATLTVTKPVPVLSYTGPTNATHGASITLSATLKTSAGAAIANRTITFTLNGATLTATTNSSGVASVKTTAPVKPGKYTINVAFAGDATYAAASASVAIRVS